MKKFIVIYYISKDAAEKMKDYSQEEQKEGMKKWMEWAKKCGDGLVDLGSPLGNAQIINDKGSSQSHKEVAGYSILQAENMEKAKEMLEGHPHLGWNEGCEIEINECLPMPEHN